MPLRPLCRTAVLGALLLVALGLLNVAVFQPWQRGWGATDEEARQAMPGDSLVRAPTFSATRAITVNAPPDRVWPWLAQMGTGRAGFYAYDWLDNGGARSATMVLVSYQQVEAGDTIRASWHPGRAYRVKGFERNRYLLWAAPRDRVTWCWQLSRVGSSATRVVTRVRFARSWRSPALGSMLFAELADGLLVRRSLLGLKSRVEGDVRTRNRPAGAGLPFRP